MNIVSFHYILLFLQFSSLFFILLLSLGNLQCANLQVHDSFSCMVKKLCMLMKFSIEFLGSIIVFFNSMIWVLFNSWWLLFPCQMYCFVHALFSQFVQLSVFSCSSPNFLKRIILNSFEFTDLDFFRVSYWSFVFLYIPLVVSCTSASVVLDSLCWHLCNWTPLSDFTSLLHQGKFFTCRLNLNFCVCLLIISLGRLGLLLWSIFRWGKCSSSEDRGGMGVCVSVWGQLGRTADLVLYPWGCWMGSMVAWILWSDLLDAQDWISWISFPDLSRHQDKI